MIIDTLVSTPYTAAEQETPDQTSLLSSPLLIKDNIIPITGDYPLKSNYSYPLESQQVC